MRYGSTTWGGCAVAKQRRSPAESKSMWRPRLKRNLRVGERPRDADVFYRALSGTARLDCSFRQLLEASPATVEGPPQ